MEVDQNPDAPIVITDFQGQAENPHIGSGVNVGIDLYTTKEVARLSRKMVQGSNVFIDKPLYVTEDNTGVLWAQDNSNSIYFSVDEGITWVGYSIQPSGTHGRGLIVWEDYLFDITNTDINVLGPLSGAPAWTNNWWTTVAGEPALIDDSQHTVQHAPFINPALDFLYICNGRYIAYVQLGSPTAVFDPNDITKYFASDKAFIMPAFYRAENMAFLPPNTTAIGVSNALNNSQADVVIWNGLTNTTATNVISVPGATGPVKQLLTKNGILYGITDKEHGIYTINGSSAKLVDRLSLRMSNRLITGEQNTLRLSSTIYPQGADFLGPELLTAGSNYPQTTGVTQVNGTGLYPFGVWSCNIENSVIGVRYIPSFGVINANYNTNYAITVIKVLTGGVVIIGWQNGTNYGIDHLDPQNYITDRSTIFVESSLYEVGTRTLPRTFSQIEYNLIQALAAGEQIDFYYRLGLNQPYTLFHSETSATLGTNISDIITPLPWQASQYIQLGVAFNAGSGNQTLTPQFRSIILR